MSIEELILQWIANLVNFALGFLVGSIITGYFTIKVVVPRIMKNPEVQEMLQLWREGKQLLKEIVENQKRRRQKHDYAA